jgi:hypothetical protein
MYLIAFKYQDSVLGEASKERIGSYVVPAMSMKSAIEKLTKVTSSEKIISICKLDNSMKRSYMLDNVNYLY